MNRINAKRKERYEKNLAKVRQIITKHHTRSVKKLQGFLVEEYKIAISERTIKRYLAVIKKENQRQIAKKQKTPKVEQVKEHEGEITYPYMVRDPSGKEHRITGDNMTVTIGWGEDGRLITYDTKDKIWRYDNSGLPFDKNKKPTSYHKTRNNLSWDFDD